jgi:hypothetical protein
LTIIAAGVLDAAIGMEEELGRRAAATSAKGRFPDRLRVSEITRDSALPW